MGELMTEDPAGHRLAVLGAGTMGVGIASMALGHGLPVTLVDIEPDKLARARGTVSDQLRLAELLQALPPDRVAGKLTTSTEIAATTGATALIEAITEQAELKAKALTAVCPLLPSAAPIITNTSSIPVDELADAVDDPARLIGTHFMNPPYLIKQVEVVRGERTAESTLDATARLLAAVGRRPIVVRDAPGFVTSRLLHPMINDAARIVEAGTATVADVDALMEGCLGHPTGPLRTADLIGLDNLVDSLRVLHERTEDERCRPCDLLAEKVRRGELGRKTGRGFYDYPEAAP